MRKIFKYEVDPNSAIDSHKEITIIAPHGSTPLCVMLQRAATCIWMEVDTGAAPLEKYRFACLGTGHVAVPEGGKYFGSVVAGAFVWHFYTLSTKSGS